MQITDKRKTENKKEKKKKKANKDRKEQGRTEAMVKG